MPADSDTLREQLRAAQEDNLLMQEAIAELEQDDRGWARMHGDGQQEFTRNGLLTIAAAARLNYLANPLIRRAVNVRTFYTWGQGVEISARDPDVNDVVQAFLDDPLNQSVLFSHEARLERDHDLQCDGGLALALFTSPVSGHVQVRVLPLAEIVDVITDPEDSAARRYYLRRWTSNGKQMQALYPDVSYRPVARPRREGGSFGGSDFGRVTAIGGGQLSGGIEVRWDSPVMHVRTGGLGGMKFGVPEVYAALPWARAYRGFLEDWASIAKALSKFAWRGTARPGRTAALRQATEAKSSVLPDRSGGAQVFGSDGTADLTPISKSGATLDADSGRPLAMMVSAALDVPYTILMGDADIGNRATAQTLDRPTELAMQSRRQSWASILRALCSYAIDQAVKAPQGPLPGTVTRPREHPDREVITLAGDVDRNLDVDWPSILEHDQGELVQAIVLADGTGRVPPETIGRLLLTALGVENVDELMDDLTDDDGKFLDRDMATIVRNFAGAGGSRQVVDTDDLPTREAGVPIREAEAIPPQERFTDFTQVDAEWQAELAIAVGAYIAVRDDQSAELVAQIRDGITAPSELTLALGAAAGVILASLLRMWAVAARRASAEAAAQGQRVPVPAVGRAQWEAHATVVADLLAQSLKASAAREALRLSQADGQSDAQAQGVADHLADLTDAQSRELLGGALTAAQNGGRAAVFGQLTGGAYYAAERLDKATCGPCRAVDGTRYDTVLDVLSAYPLGGFIDCEGRERCRGLAVWWAGDQDIPR